jgi:hypothetical protein
MGVDTPLRDGYTRLETQLLGDILSQTPGHDAQVE